MKKNKGFFSQIRSRFERNRLGELLVQRGKLTPEQLRNVLSIQKENTLSFGETAISLGYINALEIKKSLFEQTAYRAVAACFTLFIGLSAFSLSSAKASDVEARSQFTQTAMIHKASYGGRVTRSLRKENSQTQLFGTREIASADISAFKKWTGILGKLEKVSFNNQMISQYRGMSLSSKVAAINEYVNKTRYIDDSKVYGKSDYWATPDEFFTRGGDCEDFAIAKYAMLKAAGVPEHKMRLAIVQDKIKNIPHAILIVYTDNGPMLLDNQLKTTRRVASVERYKPIYSINADGWWRHIS